MSPLKLSTFTSLALATALAGGCAPAPAAGMDYTDPSGPTTPMTPGEPTPPPMPTPAAPTAKYSGIYSANAAIDFTQNGVLPGIASPALNALTMIGSNPGRALVTMANASGAVNIPSPFDNILGDIITGQLDQILPPDVQNDLNLIGNIAKITKTTVLKNSLTVHTPGAGGTVEVDLQLTGAGFDFVDINGNPQHVDVTVPVAQMSASTAKMTMATLTPRPDAPVADADLVLSGGSLTIPIGAFILQAAGPLIFQPEWGVSDIQSALNKLMMPVCGNFGTAIYDAVQGLTFLEDIQPGVYTTICTTAVGLAAVEIATQLNDLTVSGVSITNGRGVLYDVSTSKPTMDHQSDRIGDGTWSWTFGSIAVPAMLSGDRTGNAM
jgi:hypothetical protein